MAHEADGLRRPREGAAQAGKLAQRPETHGETRSPSLRIPVTSPKLRSAMTRDTKPRPVAAEAPPRPRLAALINPLSFRMSLRDRARRTEQRIENAGGIAYRVSNLSAIEAALSDALDRGTERLILAGGDGTLQGAVSYLARHPAKDKLPELLVLSAGRTNYVAADLGTRAHFLSTLDRLFEKDARPTQLERRTLALHHPSLGEQHGFFLAGAMLDQAIRTIHAEWIDQPGWRRGRMASALGATRLLPALLTDRPPFVARRLDVDAGTLGRLDAPMRFLLMTTLGLDDQHARPYARRGEGPLRLTATAVDAERWRRRVPAVLRGRFSAKMVPATGYLSGHTDDVTIHGLDAVTVDGQEFDLDPAVPLKISAGPRFRFLQP
jgi:diacylglycerol kinase (ATP)